MSTQGERNYGWDNVRRIEHRHDLSFAQVRSPECCAPTPMTHAHAFCVVPFSLLWGQIDDKRFLIHTAKQLLRIGVHRQHRVDKEVQGLGPIGCGTQALDCLMAGKVGVRQLL